MKTYAKLVAILFVASAAWADNPNPFGVTSDTNPPVSISTESVTPYASQPSTTPPSAAVVGETSSAPMPQALTDASGGGVFVTLTRTAVPSVNLPTNTQIITQEDIRAHDSQTVGDVLKFATSVQIPSQGTVGTIQLGGIRGATSNQTQVMIDGRPVGGAGLSGSQDLSEIPVEQIDHVEIVRGGLSALYGPNALGGVINIITKRAQYAGTPISHISIETGSFDRQATRLDFASRTGPVDYTFYGDTQRESGFRNNSDARTHNIGGNAGLSMGKGGKLLFDAMSYHSNAQVPGQFFPDLNPSNFNGEVEKVAQTPHAGQVTDTNYLRTSYILPLPMDTLLTLRAFGSQRETTFTDPDEFLNFDRHEQTKGIDAQYSLPYGLLVGGNFLHDRLDSADFVTPANNYTAFVENWGIFGQDMMQWKTFSLIPSGRYDHNSIFGDTKNPRVELMDDVTDWLRLSGDAGRSFRAPTLDDLFTPLEDFGFGFSYQGNPHLKPETAWTYDGGFEVHQESFSIKATYFRSNINNLIQTTSDLASTTINIGEARRQGVEVEVAHVDSAYFQDRWNYTYLKSQGIPLGFDHMVALRLSPKNTVNYVATITPCKNVTFDNTLKYVSTEFEGNDESSTKIGDHLTWDMRLAYMWRQLELYVGMEDVTNKRYEERGGYPLPGRTTYAGIKLHLWG